MSISDTIGSVTATNPVVGVAVSKQSTASAILTGLQSGDPGTSALLDAVSSQALEANQLLTSLMPHLGSNVNTTA
ncbi:MAG: hypothetical protein ACRYFS_04275 [Janthinobacterium lividum]